MSKFLDLTGQRFGRLVVLDGTYEHITPTGNHYRKHKCICDCGNYTYVASGRLRDGSTRSCGCWRKEVLTKQARANYKHGASRDNAPLVDKRLYRIWKNMLKRCENSNNEDFHFYGERGISICEDWHTFEKFREWSLLNGYGESLTIDRIDVNGDYCPTNCRWATRTVQSNNMRSNRLVDVNGNKHTIADWSRLSGINGGTIRKRLKLGWSPFTAVYAPVTRLSSSA